MLYYNNLGKVFYEQFLDILLGFFLIFLILYFLLMLHARQISSPIGIGNVLYRKE